jgi:hypothetical protein
VLILEFFKFHILQVAGKIAVVSCPELSATVAQAQINILAQHNDNVR